MRLVRALTSPALITVVAFAIRLGAVCHWHSYEQLAANHKLFGYELGCVARSIVSRQGFGSPYCIPTGPTALEAPVYPYLLAGIFKLFGTYTAASAFVALTLSCLFAALTSMTVFLIGRTIFGDVVAALAGWGWAFYPYSILYAAARIWETSLSALLLSLIFLVTLKLDRSDHHLAWFGLGLLWSLAALTNVALLAFFPFSLAWAWWRRRGRQSGSGRLAAVALLGLVLGVTPWLIRNYAALGRPVFIRDDLSMQLHMGNHEGATRDDRFSYFPWGNSGEMEQYRDLGELAYMAEKRRQALNFIARSPGAFAWLTFGRFQQFWIGTWPGLPFFGSLWRPQEGQFVVTLIMLVLAFGGLAVALRSYRSEALLFSTVLLAHPLVYYVTQVDPRYRHPLDPEMVVLAAYAFASVISKAHKVSLPRASDPPGARS